MRGLERGSFLALPSVCLLVCLVWAGIYLPGLGSLPLKHEEPRRALPAIYMLKSGDWLLPRIGASPYLRKPPMLNWLIAISFRVAGGQSEFAARLPSALAVLALALTVVITGRRWLGPAGTLLAAIFVLTNLAVMETGRQAELEALYLSLTGIALMLWLTGWQSVVNEWRLWCAPAPFLALGMLTKGPAHLVFFYGVAGAVLVYSGRWRTLLHPAHGVALLLIIAPFLVWAIPCAAAVSALDHLPRSGGAWAFWWREISSRTTFPPSGHFSLAGLLLRIPQGFANFLPWTVLLPLLWSPVARAHFDSMQPRDLALFRGARTGMTGTFLVMSLLPDGSARYVYPLVLVPCLLLAWVMCGETPCLYPIWMPGAWRSVNRILCLIIICAASSMPFFMVATARVNVVIAESCVIILLAAFACCHRYRHEVRVLPFALASAAGMMLITAIYDLAAIPQLNRAREGLPREVAAAIRTRIPAGKTLGILDDGYHAFWYYLEPSVVYFRHLDDVRSLQRIDYFLLPDESFGTFIEEAGKQGAMLAPIDRTYDAERHAFVLLGRTASL